MMNVLVLPARPCILNISLEQDAATLLECWKAMGKSDFSLKMGAWDDVSKWKGVKIKKGRITELNWGGQGLKGEVPPRMGGLTALTVLDLHRNDLRGHLPEELSNLPLVFLSIASNNIFPLFHKSFGNLTSLRVLKLNRNDRYKGWDEVQDHLWMYRRLRVLSYLDLGIKISAKRRSNPSSPPKALHPLFTYVFASEDITDLVLSFLDPSHVCVKDRNNLLKCWKAMDGDEDRLRQGHGEDVSRWKGVMVEAGRVTQLFWRNEGLSGTIPAGIEAFSDLTVLNLKNNALSGLLPPELGNLTSLRELILDANNLSGVLPASLADLTNLSTLSFTDNNLIVPTL